MDQVEKPEYTCVIDQTAKPLHSKIIIHGIYGLAAARGHTYLTGGFSDPKATPWFLAEINNNSKSVFFITDGATFAVVSIVSTYPAGLPTISQKRHNYYAYHEVVVSMLVIRANPIHPNDAARILKKVKFTHGSI
jgi:hypothetical protein